MLIEAAIMSLLLAGEVQPSHLDSLDQRLRAAGAAVDCGRVGSDGSNRGAVNRCVRDNFLKNRPFFARYDAVGEDSTIATGIVLEESPGGVYIIGFDSIACIPSNCEKWCGTVVHLCRQPKLLTRGEDGLRLVCKDEYYF